MSNKISAVLILTLFAFQMLWAGQPLRTAEFEQNTYVVNAEGRLLAWVFFTDKGPQNRLAKLDNSQVLTERSLERRRLLRPDRAPVDYSDYPLHTKYVQSVSAMVDKIRSRSRWLNAVSVEATSLALKRIAGLPFVERVQPLRPSRKDKLPQNIKPALNVPRLHKTAALDYGTSYDQVAQIKADQLHAQGITGSGVLICMLDDGWNLLYHHIAFDSLDIKATWDFTHNDTTVDDSGYEASEGWHGTKTLSTIAGYIPGKLIGTAFDATYILAKTEVDASETPVEEDYWVAGIEWADSLGADLVSSSLGYIDWYTPEQMDGNTAVTTIAADLAVEKGMAVFNSAGNEYDNASHNTLIAPADGDNVMAVAAVTSDGTRSGFSSVGPSADGRTKPDIAAMGSNVTTASTTNDTLVLTGNNGTSYACPIAAGASALLLQAFPGLTPGQLYQALKATASQKDTPDKYLGWGIIDVAAAYNYIDTSGLVDIPVDLNPSRLELKENYPNPFNPSTTLVYRTKYSANVVIKIYDTRGRLVKTFKPGYVSGGPLLNKQVVSLLGFSSGIYFYQISARELGSGHIVTKGGKMVLLK